MPEERRLPCLSCATATQHVGLPLTMPGCVDWEPVDLIVYSCTRCGHVLGGKARPDQLISAE